jgi:thiamine-monophosphate kinase
VAPKKRPGEFALIERYFRPLATDRGAFNLADDAALYRQRPDDDLVLTTDMVAAGVHFFADDPPESIARKALRVNLSDLAAKGADPFGYLLSLALPVDWTEAWMKHFADGLAADQKAYGVTLLGGDTTKAAGGLTIAITAIGRVPKGQIVLRSGAQPGDGIFVSGTIGDGALGLRLRRGKAGAKGRGAKHLLDRYLHPQPRMALAPVLRAYASAAMDVSDGLVGDLAHICEASGVGAEIEADGVPLSPAAAGMLAADRHLLATILNGGDDYEILATVPESAATAFVGEAEVAGAPVTRIGRIVAGKGPPVVRNPAGKTIKIASASHTHF